MAGDFYDYFRSDSGTLYLAVADVAGKGLAASLIMATVKALLPYIATGRTVVETLGELNARLCDQLGPREFVALGAGRLRPAERPARAGQRRPARPLRAARRPAAKAARGAAAAAAARGAPRARLPPVTTTLEPGDRLLLLTDGLPEAPVEGEPLGYQRLPLHFEPAAATRGEAGRRRPAPGSTA